MKVAVLCAKFGPYHEAQLRQAARSGEASGDELTGIEIAGSQSDYGWTNATSGRSGFDRRTLFPEADYWQLRGNEKREALQHELGRMKPDVVFIPGWAFDEARAGLSWAMKTRTPRVIISDSQPMDASQGIRKSLYRRTILARFDAAFVAGSPHVRYMETLGVPRDRCVTGCDVVDNSRFASRSASDSQGQDPDRRPRLLSCLRLIDRKNVPAVIEALHRAKADWTWTITGEGPTRPAIEAKIRELGMTEKIRLTGRVDEDALVEEYHRADVYIQPSLAEPWGLAVNEAMAAGLPVMVSDPCGCAEDLVSDGVNGLRFDPRDPVAIREALDRMSDERKRWPDMGKASSKIIADWDLPRYSDGFWKAAAIATGVRGRKGTGGFGDFLLRRVL
ncbi:MAG: glycosyltransferase family 4 protein [Euryarchaeota archaeon]|nr:glycosyltransferase family 4 protein [Euryarchaeota archaeon]